eukprot:jgi/Ulvmu1/12079/UM084_0001.1
MIQFLVFVVALLSPLRLSDARGLPPGWPDDVPCCDKKDRVCCDGRCHPPGTVFVRACESESCGCPDEEVQGNCCPPDHYCCNGGCTHNSVDHVWCGPPDAPTCCEGPQGVLI